MPQLAGAADELAELRNAVVAAVRELPQRWVAIGVAGTDERIGPRACGTFAGFGVDVPVGLSADAAEFTQLPLCALITGWVRGNVRPDAGAEVRCLAADHDVDVAVDRGRRWRAEIDEAADPVGVLVIADGANTLTPSAPGGYQPDSVAVQQALDDALATGDAAALTRLPATVVGRTAFAALAGMVETPSEAVEHYRGAPYGVGYFVGVWQP